MSESAARSSARIRATMGIWSSPSRRTVRFAPFIAMDEAPATSRLLTPEMFARSESVFRCTVKLGGPQLSRMRAAAGMDLKISETRAAKARSVGMSSPEMRICTGMPKAAPVSSCRMSTRAPGISASSARCSGSIR